VGLQEGPVSIPLCSVPCFLKTTDPKLYSDHSARPDGIVMWRCSSYWEWGKRRRTVTAAASGTGQNNRWSKAALTT